MVKVFGKGKLLICPAVMSDLNLAKSELVRKVAITDIFRHTKLNKQEQQFAEGIHSANNLGMGEAECIAFCKMRNAVFVTNDQRAIRIAEKNEVGVVDLETILYSLRELISKSRLRKIISDIEEKDKVIIVNKDKILEQFS